MDLRLISIADIEATKAKEKNKTKKQPHKEQADPRKSKVEKPRTPRKALRRLIMSQPQRGQIG